MKWKIAAAATATAIILAMSAHLAHMFLSEDGAHAHHAETNVK